jgi:hypothetical protein
MMAIKPYRDFGDIGISKTDEKFKRKETYSNAVEKGGLG